jgi:hypothetical protein
VCIRRAFGDDGADLISLTGMNFEAEQIKIKLPFMKLFDAISLKTSIVMQ